MHMVKLTETREITPYLWVHPDEDGASRAACDHFAPGSSPSICL